MAKGPSSSRTSFDLLRRWGIGVRVVLTVALVLAVVGMLNYLSRDYYLRLQLGARTKPALSSRTRGLLQGLTNQVKVTLYYDKEDSLYSTVAELLKEYRDLNPKFSLQVLDYLRDAGLAQKLKTEYKLGGAADKNLVIFDCEGRVKIVPGAELAQYALEQVPNAEKPYRRKLVQFAGEKAFTAALIAVTNPKPFKACFLGGHREHRVDSGDGLSGYLQFGLLLQQNYVRVEPLLLSGTNSVPADCDLLIIPGPATPLLESEPDRIEQYLKQGGRLLVLFNADALDRETGLEPVLARWGVTVGASVIVDTEHSPSGSDADLVVSGFLGSHPVVNPLVGSGIYMIRPRPVGKTSSRPPPADGPKVEDIAFSGTNSFLLGKTAMPHRMFPVVAAVEKGAVKDVVTERGTTRIVVVGDSYCLANSQLNLLGNRDFAGAAINWLLDRPQLLHGVEPRPVQTFTVVMTPAQLAHAEVLLLGVMPGAVLLVGSLVWLRRRR